MFIFPVRIDGVFIIYFISIFYIKINFFVTTDSNLWSCGYNLYGQLCLGNKENQLKPQKTSFSNISKISTGWDHSLFQNDKGEIFSCGLNQFGQCGLGHFDYRVTPSLILLQILSNLFVEEVKVYFSIQKEMYFRLGIM